MKLGKILGKAKRKQAAVLVGLVMLILGAFNVALTPAQHQYIEYGIDVFILAGGITYIKKLVASQDTVEKLTNKSTADIVFKRRERR